MIVDLTLEVDDDQDPDCHNKPGQLRVNRMEPGEGLGCDNISQR
jgi:hypothetical protein